MTTPSLADYKTPRPWLTLAVFLIIVIGVGGLIGTMSSPDGWYEALAKPAFNPPNWVFAPVWFLLYVLIAIAGWRIWMIDPRSPPMMLWFVQMALNWAWSPVWFVGHATWPAFAIIVALALAIAGFILTAWRHDPVAGGLFVPYLAWVGFASVLNLFIALAN
ncbi:MAG: sensor histidine kinase [Pelagibacterium sp. SCN 64-44]|nr:MAG: sensor histidine kinase [Pelagibacterium sp. SCN 64-44]